MKTEKRTISTERSEECEQLRKDLTYAMFKKNVPGIQDYLLLVAEKGFELELEAEVLSAALLLDRLEEEATRRSRVRPVGRGELIETKQFLCPPADVKTVLLAATILLGHDFTSWREELRCLRAVGNESFLKQIERLDTRTIPLERALRAQEVMAGLELEGLRKVSMSSAELGRWCWDVIETVLTRGN